MKIETQHNHGDKVYYLRVNQNVGEATITGVRTISTSVDNTSIEYLLSDHLSIWRPESKLFKSKEDLAAFITGVKPTENKASSSGGNKQPLVTS